MNIQQVSALPEIDCRILAMDIETTTLTGKKISDPFQDRIVALAVSDGDNVWILRDNFQTATSLLTNPDYKKLFFNAAFDLSFLNHQLGIETVNVSDILLAERILHAGENMPHGLQDVLARRCGVFTDKSIRDSFSAHTGPFTHEQLQYIATDVAYLRAIREQQIEDISKAALGKVMALEMQVLPVVVSMILRGVGFDRDVWAKNIVWIEDRMQAMRREIANKYQLGYQPSLVSDKIDLSINLNSTDQIQELLHTLGIDLDSTAEPVVQAYLDAHPDAPFLNELLEWRGWQKMLSMSYPEHVSPITGRIHASWNQVPTDTGRMSCSEPSLQNVPRPDEDHPEYPDFRGAFIPRPGYSFIVADYSQQEMRVLAEYSQDETLLRGFEEGLDIHTATAAAMYGIPMENVSKHQRFSAKAINFGIVFGMGPQKLAGRLKISVKEAEKFLANYLSRMPGVNKYITQTKRHAIVHGYVTTLLGRRRYFPVFKQPGVDRKAQGKAEREAINMPIQGTAADIVKTAMSTLYPVLNEYDAGMVLQIHDELVIEAREDQVQEVLYQVVGAFESAMAAICPTVKPAVDAEILQKWGKV